MSTLDRAKLAGYVRAERKARRLSAAELADILHVSQSTITRLEATQHSFSSELLVNVLNWLDMHLEEFLKQPEGDRP